VQTVTAPSSPGTATSDTSEGTRARVARLLLERGPQTAAALAGTLGLTPAGVRRHLDAMIADGSLVTREQRPRGPRGRGRPARVFCVTDSGRALTGPQAYDALAGSALRFLAESGGDGAIAAFARSRADGLERQYAGVTDVHALAGALTADGYAATVETVPGVLAGAVALCQHHCPVQHVAAEFPQLCAAETEALGRVLGTHVTRLATIAHGDGVCTTHVPAQQVRPTEGSRP